MKHPQVCSSQLLGGTSLLFVAQTVSWTVSLRYGGVETYLTSFRQAKRSRRLRKSDVGIKHFA
jgi:hypothetical protein